MDIHVGMGGPEELLKLLAKLHKEHEEGKCGCDEPKPLFVVNQHPEIEKVYNELKGFDNYAKEQLEEIMALVKQRKEFLERKHKTLHKRVWEDIETLMKEKGLYPSDYNRDSSDEYLSVRDGVMYHVKKG